MDTERERELLSKAEPTADETAEWHRTHVYVQQQETDDGWMDMPIAAGETIGAHSERLFGAGRRVRLIRRNTESGDEAVIQHYDEYQESLANQRTR